MENKKPVTAKQIQANKNKRIGSFNFQNFMSHHPKQQF